MPAESTFVEAAKEVAERILPPPLFVKRGAALLYQVTVDNRLSLTVDVKRPIRGYSAFQTDLCVFEKKTEEVSIPRVVMEFKTSITTHDVLTYSAKATKHKQVYPYLRYGIVASGEKVVPGRLFTHNESLDSCACVSGLEGKILSDFFASLLSAEVKSSHTLEAIAFGTFHTRLFRTEIMTEGSSSDHRPIIDSETIFSP
jgi:hypothetical protein